MKLRKMNTEYIEFLASLKIVIEDYNWEYQQLHPILKINNNLEEINDFQKKLKLWKDWERINWYNNKINKKFKWSTDFYKIQDVYTEFLVWYLLFIKFWIENVDCDVKSVWNKDVDFSVVFEWVTYYIEVKNIWEEARYKGKDIKWLVPLNSKRIIDKFKDYHTKFLKESYNIMFLNFQNGLVSDNIDFLFWETIFWTDENFDSIKYYEYNGFLSTEEWRKIWWVFKMNNLKFESIKWLPNLKAYKIIPKSFATKLIS